MWWCEDKINRKTPHFRLPFVAQKRCKLSINYDLDITNISVVSPQVRSIEVFDITKPRFSEQIWLVLSDFVNRGSSVMESKQVKFFQLSHGRKPKVNISHVRSVVSLRF